MNTPRTAIEANRLAKTWAKASTLLSEGYNFVTCTTADSPVLMVAVYKPDDALSSPSYWLREGFTTPEIANGCTCPDFQRHGNYCKHTLCYDDIRSMEAAIAQWEKEQAEAECANGVDYLY